MPRRRTLSDDEIRALQEGASTLGPGELRRYAEERAAILGCHWSTVYRAVRAAAPSGRRRRADAGASRVLDEQTFMDLAAMVTQFDYDAEMAIDTLNANRVLQGQEPIEIHPETLRRHLRARGVSRRHNRQDLRIHERWEAPYPGYLFQIDSTVAASYYIDDDDSIGYEAAVRRNKNKAGNGKPRVWIMGGVDDHSRVGWAQFYTGNDALVWLDFMLRCWRGFADPDTWPAFGVPERVYTDQDSAMKSRVVTRALELLEVQRMLALPSTEHFTNAQAKGKVERWLQVVMQGFERMTRWKRFTSLREMNDALVRYLVWRNRKPHSETGVPPFERWLEAPHVTLLPPEEITRRMSYQETERVVSPDLSIQLEGKTYQLPRRPPFIDLVRRRVRVFYLASDLSSISVLIDGQEHEISAVEALPNVAGEFRQAPEPQAVKLKKELIQRDLSHVDPHAILDYRSAQNERSYPIRPKAEPHPLALAASLTPRTIRRGPAVDRAQREGVVSVPPTELERKAIDALFAGQKEIPEDVLTAWIQARRGGGRGDQTAHAGRA